MLWVEGELDAVLISRLVSLMDSPPTVMREGSKNALRPKVLAERMRSREGVFYLRDRDFDFDTVVASSKPCPELSHEFGVLGWHWSRHEIENYLLEPGILLNALRLNEIDVIIEQIQEAARRVRHYTAARWTIGTARRVLPPHYQLSTRFQEQDTLKIPDWDEEACREWVVDSTGKYLKRVEDSLRRERIEDEFQCFVRKFNENQCSDTQWVLHMFSGKDLFAAMEPWFKSLGFPSAGAVRNEIRNWVSEHIQVAVIHLPEWQGLLEELEQQT